MNPATIASRRRFLQSSAASLALASLLRRARGAESQLLVRSADPFNAEPNLAKLVSAAVTPVEQFYVRNHGPTPKVEAQGFQMRVEGLVGKPGSWSLAELRGRFTEHSAE